MNKRKNSKKMEIVLSDDNNTFVKRKLQEKPNLGANL